MSRPRIEPALVAQVAERLTARDTRPGRERPQSKLKVTAHADGAAEMLIYDEISYWGVSAQDVAEQLAGVRGDLKVRINSPGGDVFDGVAIFNMLVNHPGRVTVEVDGLAASAASFIAMAGDRIVMGQGAQMMIHDASGFAYGNAATMTEMAELLDRVSETIASIYASRTGVDAATWREAMRAETWYSGEEAVEAGLADEVARPVRQPDQDPAEPMAARWDLSVFRFAGRAHAPAPDLTPAAGAEPAREPEPDPVAAVAPATDGGTGDEGRPAELPVPEPGVPAPTPEPAPAPSIEDEWAALAAHLTNPPSERDEWARLREAML